MGVQKVIDDEFVLSQSEPAVPARTPPQGSTVPDIGFEPFRAFQGERDALAGLLSDLSAIGGDRIERKIDELQEELSAFAPAVTMIGQIKSGKTTLVNAMIGRPGLLPADVNPWTSVVTSLHLGHPRGENEPRAAFRFFDSDEWDALMRHGGRMGELAGRAGADREVEKLRNQVQQMREKTKARLGRRFEMMLGQTHDYARFDPDLIQRYVCMADGAEDEGDTAKLNGQFADITRSADLWLDDSALPIPFTLRDTPGVNDTFMMREQITIRALRDSRTCVVVLSAHQALSTTDMGLIRLISNMNSAQVVIFVNRIDELGDPVAEIPEIRQSLETTLQKHDALGGIEPTIVFGSAHWAEAVVSGGVDALDPASAEALQAYAAATLGAEARGMDVNEMVWRLSGVGDLFSAIGARVQETACAAVLDGVRKSAANYLMGVRASSNLVTLNARSEGPSQRMPEAEVTMLLNEVALRFRSDLTERLAKIFDRFGGRVDQVHDRFLERALDSLIDHLETRGENAVWSYSPDGLRVLMRSAHSVMRRNVTRACDEVFAACAAEMSDAYGRIFDVEATNFALQAPPAPETPQPMILAQTIALDLKTSWWRAWWNKRRGYRAHAAGFGELIRAETGPMVDELKSAQASEIRDAAMRRLDAFLAEQRDVLADMSRRAGTEDLEAVFGMDRQREREMLLDTLCEELGVDLPEAPAPAAVPADVIATPAAASAGAPAPRRAFGIGRHLMGED